MVSGPIVRVGPGPARAGEDTVRCPGSPGAPCGGSLWAVQMKPVRTSGKAWGDGAACLADEKLVEHLLANRCMAAVAEHVCCSLMLPQFSHDTAADLTHAGSGPTLGSRSCPEWGWPFKSACS